ncbi:MAG: glycosyltransferase family 2 protein [Pirellulaceae bacterium]
MNDSPAEPSYPMDVSVVVPVYNSADMLAELVRRTLVVLEGAFASYEIVLIDDGSVDRSWEVLCELQAKHSDHLVVIQLMRNFGQHNALMCGLRRVGGRLVVTMDDDLQTPPEEIPKLVERIETGGFDLVYGQYESKQHELWRNLGSGLVNLFYRFVFRSQVKVTSFRTIRRELSDKILSYDLNFTYLDGLLAWNSQRIAGARVEHHPRTSGRSGYSLAKLVILAMNLFTNFSLFPLQMVSMLGFVFALFGFTLGTYYIFRAIFQTIVVPGYASLIVSIFILGGAQLLALGVLGEYLGRLHLNVNRKPQYGIRHVIARSHDDHLKAR